MSSLKQLLKKNTEFAHIRSEHGRRRREKNQQKSTSSSPKPIISFEQSEPLAPIDTSEAVELPESIADPREDLTNHTEASETQKKTKRSGRRQQLPKSDVRA